MAQQRLAHTLFLVAALFLLVLAALGAWFAARQPAALRTPVRGGGAGAGIGTGADEAPPGEAPASPGPGGSGAPLSGAAAVEPPAAPADGEAESAETLSGVVLTAGGAPIAGARVEAARGGDSRSAEGDDAPLLPARGSGRTNAAGRFDIGGIAGGHYDLEVAAPGFGRRRVARAPSRKPGAREEPLRIVLHPELFLVGEVVDRGSRPIEGAGVTLAFLAEDGSDLTGGGEGERLPGTGAAGRVRTDAGGRFRIGGLGRGVYRAEAVAAGRSPGFALVEIGEPGRAEESRLVLVLDESLVLRGIVQSEGGEPLAGARVRLHAASAGRRTGAAAGLGREVRTTATGTDGAFEISGLPAETYRLEVSASAHRDRALHAAVGGDPVQIVLVPAVLLEGSIVDRDSGDAVPDAEVRWLPDPGAESDAEPAPAARTDAAGRFRIESFSVDGRAFRIEAEGYSTLEVDAPVAAADGGWTIALERSSVVRGRVRTAGDLPVEGLRVSLVEVPGAADPTGSLWLALSRPVSVTSTTDVSGQYRLLAPRASSYRVVVDGHPYAAASSAVLDVPDGRAEVKCADIFLVSEATVRGFISGGSLGRVAGARVLAIPVPPEEEPASGDPQLSGGGELAGSLRDSAASRADAAGAFALGGLRAGAYRIAARAPGFATALSEPFPLVAGGSQAVDLELKPEMSITGRIAGPDGEPVPFAEVRAAVAGGDGAGEPWSQEMSLSTTAGTFRLSRLGARPYDLWFWAEGFAPAFLRGVAAGSEDVGVRIERLVSLAGRVLGAHTAEPVAEFKLGLRFEDEQLLPVRERASLRGWRSFSEPAGAFRIDGLPPGGYLVEVAAGGHLDVDPVKVEVPIDGRDDAEIRLVEAGLVMGVVVDAHLNAVAGARVEALQRQVDPNRGTVSFRPIGIPAPRSEAAAREPREEGGGRGRRRGRDGDRSPAAARSGSDGGFVLRGLPDGVYRFRVAHDDHLSRELGDYVFENGLSGGEPVALEVLLPSGVTLLGRVRSERSVETGAISVVLRPVAAGRESWARGGARTKSAEVDDSGHFEIRGLEVGDYVLQARFRRADGSYDSIRRDVNIHGAGREQGILLDFSR
jgi:protocatechuate 3,4-dioxygenase beta subunit